ncbi:MAG: FKBP-type peptidyl-prolyl cis-trans isomerase [Bacteroidales bacterium]|nr:FKBP-type peptidyl-prolyl cis-trans isomerase [Bacteroidales bacterium]
MKQVHVSKDSLQIQEGDIVCVSMQYATLKDSIFFDSKKEITPIWIPIHRPSFEGDIMKGLLKMHVGDSCIFKVRVDSFFVKTMGYQTIPEYLQDDSMMYVRIKILERKSKEEFEVEKKIIEDNLRKQYELLREKEQKDLQTYLEINQIKTNPLPSGLYYIPIKQGYGKKPVPGQKVLVFYEATFIDGQIFDRTDPFNPIVVIVGSPDLIEGFNEALLHMREGEKAQWIIPSSKAFGKSSIDSPIPPYTTLIFTITLYKILP